MTILVVEDNLEYNKVVSEALQASGHHVLTAMNGKIAFELLHHFQVDLVISDIIMPECSGTQLHDMVRHDDRLCRTPFIYVTADPCLRINTAITQPSIDFIVSKVPFERLLTAVAGIIYN